MISSRRRLIYLVLAVPVVMVISAAIYMIGMQLLEGETRNFWQSLEFAAETLSTTGYGADSQWSHPVMVVFVVTLQFLGVLLVFLMFPIYLVPFMEERFETKLPTLAKDAHDHVVVFRYSAAVEALVEEVAESDHKIVVAEPDERTARRLFDRGVPVVWVQEDLDALVASNALEANLIIANGNEEENAGIILRARHAGYSKDIFALVEDPERRRPIELAGANAVYTPKHILGAAIAARASYRLSPILTGIQNLGPNLEIHEVRVTPESPLAGQTLIEADFTRRTGVTVLAQWRGAELEPHPDGRTMVEPWGILILLGRPERIQSFIDSTEGVLGIPRASQMIIAGCGEVGSKVRQLLTDAGDACTTIDLAPKPGVDIVGSALDTSILERAGIQHASSLVIALDSDDGAILLTVVARDLARHIPIIARVNQDRNVETVRRAGADLVLSISQVTGQMLSSKIYGTPGFSLDRQFRIVRHIAGSLAGRHPARLEMRERTGCAIIALERENDVLVTFPPEFEFRASDVLYVTGTDEGIRKFHQLFG